MDISAASTTFPKRDVEIVYPILRLRNLFVTFLKINLECDYELFVLFIVHADVSSYLLFILNIFSFILLFYSGSNMRLFSFSVAGILAAGALAVPTPDTHVVHEQQQLEISRRWRKIARREEVVTMPVPVRIGLKQNNINQAHELLMDV